ncbi:MAG: GntR family transcriptional regulator [Acetobacteraceae bacterium]
MPEPQPAPPRTKAAAAHERLRADLLSCAVAPGARLPVEFVCDRYGVGPTPAREALNRLAAEGLVTLAEQRGFTAAEVSAAELTELTETRCLIEEAALRRSMQTRDPAWEENLLLAAHRLARTPSSAAAGTFLESPEWERQHAAFHAALIGGTGARRIAAFCGTLNEQFRRYRALAMRSAYPDRDAHAEHEALAREALRGEADQAARLLGAHYRRTASIILQSLGAPDPYAATRA